MSRRLSPLRWGLLALRILFIAIGIGGGEHLEVMRKAVRICMECIGIG